MSRPLLIHPEVRELLFVRGLWGELQCRFVYYAPPEIQWRAIPDLEELRWEELAWNDEVRGRLEALAALGARPECAPSVAGVRDALVAALRRELDRRREVPMPADIGERVRAVITAFDFYDPRDLLEIVVPEDAFPKLVYGNYISVPCSPDYHGTEGPWDRDTQFKFEMGFGTGLLIWLSANVARPFQGRHIGTRFFKALEALAVSLEIRRFSVPGDLNGPYWMNAMGYALPRDQTLFRDPDHPIFLEAYKEAR